jgi:hypothetical protein
MGKELNITLQILGKPYKMKVMEEAEANLRFTFKRINELAAIYRKSYVDRDEVEYLSMAIITYIAENNNGLSSAVHNDEIEWIQKIEQAIEK